MRATFQKMPATTPSIAAAKHQRRPAQAPCQRSTATVFDAPAADQSAPTCTPEGKLRQLFFAPASARDVNKIAASTREKKCARRRARCVKALGFFHNLVAWRALSWNAHARHKKMPPASVLAGGIVDRLSRGDGVATYSQFSAPPVWYSVTRVSKKLRSFFRSIISLIHGNGFSSWANIASRPICCARRFAMKRR